MPRGFLGTDADIVIDIIIVLLPGIVGVMYWSRRLARAGRHRLHSRVQLGLTLLLAVAVTVLEVDLRTLTQGGFAGLAARSRFAGTPVIGVALAVHLVFATLAALSWTVLVAVSLRRFGWQPQPGGFSATHRRVGRAAMVAMGGTALTGLLLYVLAFVMVRPSP